MIEFDFNTYNFADGITEFIWAQGSDPEMFNQHTKGNYGYGTFTWPEGKETDENKNTETHVLDNKKKTKIQKLNLLGF